LEDGMNCTIFSPIVIGLFIIQVPSSQFRIKDFLILGYPILNPSLSLSVKPVKAPEKKEFIIV